MVSIAGRSIEAHEGEAMGWIDGIRCTGVGLIDGIRGPGMGLVDGIRWPGMGID